jgi:transcriptional regulator with XRE-family HTH domain
MPRPNPPRALLAEPHLAARVAIEREQRGWSYEGLAKRMADVGCPIQSSAIYKIEKGAPKRRITVDELVGFSIAFELTVEELLIAPELRASADAARLLEQWGQLHQQYARNKADRLRLEDDLDKTMERLVTLVSAYPQTAKALRTHLPRLYPEHAKDFWTAFKYSVVDEEQS